MTKTKNAGIFGLLLFMLLTGCDFVEPDDQYQLGPDSQIHIGEAYTGAGSHAVHPEGRLIRAICIGRLLNSRAQHSR